MTEISLDENGNELKFSNETYSLTLANQMRIRKIAEVKEKDSIFYLVCRRKYSEHYFVSADSWGFNYCMIVDFEDKHPKGKVIVISEVGRFMTDISTILDEGKFLHFKESGFERQIFLHNSLFKKKENESEARS